MKEVERIIINGDEIDLSNKISKDKIGLKIVDGLLYVCVNDNPVGAGVRISAATEAVIGDNPTYFADETIDTITKVRKAMSESDNCIFIPFITDTHIYTSSNNQKYFDEQIAAMKAVCAVIKPTLVVHGGDMSNGSEAKETTLAISKHVVDSLREIGGDDTLILIGNHDTNNYYNSGAEPIAEVEMLANYCYWDDGFTYADGKLYGYRDIGDNIRILRLHTSMGDGTGADGKNWGYPQDEIDWFTALANSCAGKDIIVFAHMTQTPEYQGTQANNLPHNGTVVRDGLEQLVSVLGCKVVGFSGHCHWDYMAKHANYYETTTCLGNYLPSFDAEDGTPTSSYRTPPDGAVMRGRTAGTLTQGLWDAIVINPDSKKVSMIRFGAGEDRVFSYGDSSIAVTGISLSTTSGALTEGDTVTLTATIEPSDATNQTILWSTSNKDVATVSGGVVTAKAEGTATITATTVDGGFTATYELTVSEKVKINQLTLATDTSGNLYNDGLGYKEGYRLGSSGNESAQVGCYVTGFIPCKAGQTITFKDFDVNSTNDTGYNYCYIAAYKSDKSLIKSSYSKDVVSTTANKGTLATYDTGYVKKVTLNAGGGGQDLSEMAYIRVSAKDIGAAPTIYVD